MRTTRQRRAGDVGRRRRTASLLVTTLVATSLLSARPASVAADSVTEALTDAMGLAPVAAPVSLGGYRVAGAPRIAVISSGVDPAVLPESLRSRITVIGEAGDKVGLGTFTTSQLLQLSPGATITSVNVYPGGRFNADALVWTGNHLASRTADFDAVLYAVAPRDYLDPVSSSMARGLWPYLDEAISRFGLPGSNGPVYGVPLWGNVRHAQTTGIDNVSKWLIDDFANHVNRWATVAAALERITAAGVPIVSPAGDEGSGLQRVFGVANFPNVITVAAAEGDAIVPVSAAGPSISGGIKPDIAAPSGVIGLLPESSSVANHLRKAKRLDSSLVPDWDAGAPATSARARLASTFSSASVVTAAVAGMAASGLRDTGRQRAALAATAVPVPGQPVWRQGAGVVRFAPDAALAGTTPLVVGAADLGAEPSSGPWSAALRVENGTAGVPTATVADFMGVGPDGRNRTSTGDPFPVTASVSEGGIVVSAPAGDSTYEGGLFCGYTEIPVVGTGGAIDPRLSAHGVPEGTEQVPTCLVNGSTFDAFGFYLHQLGAEDETFALLPALPPGASILERPLMILPVNPLHTTLFSRTTGADGHARFHNVPPGYYRIKLFSDYGAPMSWSVNDAVTGAAVPRSEDTGEAMGYQALDVLVLPPGDEQVLVDALGADRVHYDKTTETYLVDTAPGVQLRVALGKMKKAVGVGITSRIIDLLGYGDFTDLSADLASVTNLPALETLGSVGSAWHFTPGVTDPEDTEATFDPAYLLGIEADDALLLGVQKYDFNLPTPNYSTTIDINFRYRLDSAGVLVVVQIGSAWAVGALSPNGKLTLPTISPDQGIDLSKLELSGGTSGAAHFEFDFLSRGARTGSLYLVYTPWLDPNRGAVTPFSHVGIADLSFKLGTWTNADWPPVATSHGQGHAYGIDPNYSARQMNRPLCRLTASNSKTVGGVVASVCEDWQMVVHSPLDHAATVDVLDAGSGLSLLEEMRAAGAVYANPHRGVHDATWTLAHAFSTAVGAEAALKATGGIRTNGRFWEQLALPHAVIRDHPGPVRIEVIDITPGRLSTLFPHVDGGQPVPPYVDFDPAR